MLALRRIAWIAPLSLLLAVAPVSAQGFDWGQLQPGHWYEIPNSRADSTGMQETIMSAWSGGAYDAQRDRLIVWGGGHNDSSDNAVYVFDVNSHVWSIASPRSGDTGGSEASGEYPDGTPRSRHTYHYIQYVPSIDRFCSMGGSAQYPTALQTNATNKVHCLDFDDTATPTRGWTHRSTMPGEGAIGGRSAYDPSSGHIWYHGTSAVAIPSNRLYEWDPVANVWTTRSAQEDDQNFYSGSAAIDPVHKRWVEVGGGRQRYYDISKAGMLERRDLGISGPASIVNGSSPGFDFDSSSGLFVAWNGGSTVYTLDLATNSWQECPAAPGNTVTPTPPQPNGTFGRFRYIPSRNAFVLVNDTDQNVFLYRLPEGCGGAPPDETPPSTPASLDAVALGQDAVRLSWAASNDPDSGVTHYKVYRGGVYVDQAVETTYTDDGLAESTEYSYRVSAVNGSGLESPQSAPASATTAADTTPPTIVEVDSSGDPRVVRVRYSEPVEQASATATGNYAIAPGITVDGATLDDDLVTVHLATSEHAEGVAYTLTVNNVRDRAAAPNTIAAGTTSGYEYFAELVISNLVVQSGRVYQVAEGLTVGSIAYVDRGYGYENVPPELAGSKFIQTANDDKLSQGDPFLSFDVNQPVIVFVAHDDRYATKPAWLADFTDSGSDVTIQTNFSLFRKSFPQSTIVLGGNVNPADPGDHSMYTVIVVPESAPVGSPPDDPRNLRIKRD